MNMVRPYDLLANPCMIRVQAPRSGLSVRFANDKGEELIVGYDEKTKQYYIDRTRAGKSAFNPEFAARAIAPEKMQADSIWLTIILDRSSVELFAEQGKTVLTALCFPESPYTKAFLQYNEGINVKATYAPALKRK